MPRRPSIPLDEDQHATAVVGFVHPEEEDAPALAAVEAVEVLQWGLLEIIRDGHADGAKVRAGALARLAGLYATDSEAAHDIGCSRSTLTRAKQKMQDRLRTTKNGSKPNEYSETDSPE